LRCFELRWSFPPLPIFNFFKLRGAEQFGKMKLSTIDD